VGKNTENRNNDDPVGRIIAKTSAAIVLMLAVTAMAVLIGTAVYMMFIGDSKGVLLTLSMAMNAFQAGHKLYFEKVTRNNTGHSDLVS
jgi:hypothetical protein